MKKILLPLTALILFVALSGLFTYSPVKAEPAPPIKAITSPEDGKISPALLAALADAQPDDLIPIIITLTTQLDLEKFGSPDREARLKGLITASQAIAAASQRQILSFLDLRKAETKAADATSFWVFNGLSVSVTPAVIFELAERADVASITYDLVEAAPVGMPAMSTIESNLLNISAPALWSMGYEGQGIVVASMDTGVTLNHPDLISRWRGGSNSWYDPYGEHPEIPTDLDGHGTATMGVMVGGDYSGTAIGVAPQAQWIAVKIFNDSGSATATAIHLGFQWLLDPDGDPNSADTPHVVNNSWTMSAPGCDLEFELDLQMLRAAGILPVFAAGNGGPGAYTSYSPGNNPSAFAVGATDNLDSIYYFSSRGPSSCGEAENVFPELVAPGVDILSSGRYGTYTRSSGTSIAAPHAAGGLALLLSAFPDLEAGVQSWALTSSAADLGALGPDNVFGNGRLDLLAAYQALQNPPAPTPTPIPDTNLAQDKTVQVSSYQDTSHTGAQAVDGSLGTYWQSKKTSGKKVSSDEWLLVDLGTVSDINRVVLEWDAYYAITYEIQVSLDGQTWETVFLTTAGDGGQDAIDITPTTARYVRMISTDWSSTTWRVWLQEIEIYGSAGAPAPTPTAAPVEPTPTATEPPPTPTPAPAGSVHVGDLDGVTVPRAKGRWDAEVIITIHDVSENPVSGAVVSGNWTGDLTGSAACTTTQSGQCTISQTNLKSSVTMVTFSVSGVDTATGIYDPAVNHDPDGDSDAISITLTAP